MIALLLAALGYGLIAVLSQVELAQGRATRPAAPDRFHLPWLNRAGAARCAPPLGEAPP